MRTILLVSVLLFAACKKDEKKADPAPAAVPTEGVPGAAGTQVPPAAVGAMAEAEKAAESATAMAGAAAAQANQAAAAATAAAGTAQAVAAIAVASAAEYEKKATEMTDKLIAVFSANGKNCDKLAAALTKFGDDNRATFLGLKAFEKANPAAEEAFDKKMKTREDEMEKKLSPAFEACKDHAGLQAASAKLDLGD